MDIWSEDTIVARATPPGRGAIAIIRLSGKEAVVLAQRIFQPIGGADLSSPQSHQLYHGLLRQSLPDGDIH